MARHARPAAGEGRGGALRAARDARMADWFSGRCWRVLEEMNGDVVRPDGTVLHYVKGQFWLPKGQVFQTAFGNKGRHGYIIQEVLGDGSDRQGQQWAEGLPAGAVSRAAFGWIVLKRASEQFPGSITALPPSPYGRRGEAAQPEVVYIHDSDSGGAREGY